MKIILLKLIINCIDFDEFKSNLIQTSYLYRDIFMDMKYAFDLCEEHIKEANKILNGKNLIFHK